MKKFIYLGILLLISLPAVLKSIPEQPHHTTAYIGAPGQIYILPSISWYTTDRFWNKNSKQLPSFYAFHRWSYLVYAEYAFNCCNSVTLNGGYARAIDSLNGNSQGIKDFELGCKHSIYNKETFALTGQLVAIVPAGDSKSPIRYGKCGGELGILCSDQFYCYNCMGWYDFNLAYRHFQGFPSDQIRSELALGYTFSNSAIIGTGYLTWGLFNGISKWRSNMIENNPNYRLFKAQIEYLMQFFPHVTFTIGAFKHIWGCNVGTGGGFFAGSWIDF